MLKYLVDEGEEGRAATRYGGRPFSFVAVDHRPRASFNFDSVPNIFEPTERVKGEPPREPAGALFFRPQSPPPPKTFLIVEGVKGEPPRDQAGARFHSSLSTVAPVAPNYASQIVIRADGLAVETNFEVAMRSR